VKFNKKKQKRQKENEKENEFSFVFATLCDVDDSQLPVIQCGFPVFAQCPHAYSFFFVPSHFTPTFRASRLACLHRRDDHRCDGIAHTSHRPENRPSSRSFAFPLLQLSSMDADPALT
jgi:hypothetical protein